MRLHIAQGRNPLLDGAIIRPAPTHRFPAAPTHPAPIPRAQWPPWAHLLSLAQVAADRGLGDTVARIIGPATSAAFKRWHLKKFGTHCGCEQRQAEWNAKYPYCFS